jgi:hypothetical protein
MTPRVFTKPCLAAVLFLTLAMYAATIAVALPWTVVFFALAPLLYYAGYRSYRKLLRTVDFRQAFLGVYGWLLVLIVVLPNTCMALLLYTDASHYTGALQLISFGLTIFAFVVASPYYLIPAALFSESLFLKETVISPLGLVGILASMLIWAVILMLALVPLALLAERHERH